MSPVGTNTQVQSVTLLVHTTDRTAQPVMNLVTPQINYLLSSASIVVATTITSPQVVKPATTSYFDPFIDFMV